MSTPRSRKLTRRGFLRYSGLSVGGVAFAGVLAPAAEALPQSVAAPALNLSPRRRATLVAVIGAVGSVVGWVDLARVEEVVSRFVAHYRAASPDMRETIDVTLDAVEANLEPGDFSRRSVEDRVAILRAGITGVGDGARGIRGHTDSRQSVLTENAVALAATAFVDGETRWNRDLFLAAA